MRPKIRRLPRIDESTKPCECLRCGHIWFPRVRNPVQCPVCHSAYWNTPRRY